MRQSVLPFQYEVEQKEGGLTALAGLPLYLEFAHLMGLRRMMAEKVRAVDGEQGWTDDQMIMALVLLNLAGGDCVEDLRVLEGEEGFVEFCVKWRIASVRDLRKRRSGSGGARRELERSLHPLHYVSIWNVTTTRDKS